MALNFLWSWLISTTAKFKCRLVGHDNLQLIEHHSTECVIKDFRGNDPKKLRRMKNRLGTKIYGRILCGTCRTVFNGNFTDKDLCGQYSP